MDFFSNLPQSLGTMINGIHRGNHRKKNLRRADIARRFFATDVLFTGLKGQTVGGISISIAGDSDKATGETALEFVANSKVCGMRTAISHRDAKTLGGTDHNIRAEFAGRLQQDESERITGDDSQSSGGMDLCDGRRRIMNRSIDCGILQDSTAEAGCRNLILCPHDQLDTEWLRTGTEQRDRLWMAIR